LANAASGLNTRATQLKQTNIYREPKLKFILSVNRLSLADKQTGDTESRSSSEKKVKGNQRLVQTLGIGLLEKEWGRLDVKISGNFYNVGGSHPRRGVEVSTRPEGRTSHEGKSVIARRAALDSEVDWATCWDLF
jgi:hypothetical protein